VFPESRKIENKALLKASAVCARKPLCSCTNGVKILVGFECKSLHGKSKPVTSNNRDRSSARLLRDVNLLFFVYVAEEINQTTYKRNRSQTERDPTGGVSTCGIGIGYESVEVVDRTDGCRYADNYRQNVLQAFHFEPPARNKYEG
jgi:hypothetical protein